ncbi:MULTISPECIES: hypothetical protein [unclassified Nocardia]|uniref:hypothetical protein n=1 Tax=Nocardia sp. NPDC056064 TaxID=3345701 RepID=UPI0035E2748C
MSDYDPARPLDEVPEADRVEQEQSAFHDDDADDPAFADAADYAEVAARVALDSGNANPADVIEQTLTVPYEDEELGAER